MALKQVLVGAILATSKYITPTAAAVENIGTILVKNYFRSDRDNCKNSFKSQQPVPIVVKVAKSQRFLQFLVNKVQDMADYNCLCLVSHVLEQQSQYYISFCFIYHIKGSVWAGKSDSDTLAPP